MIGQTISHYRILTSVGQDAAGVLYRAVDTRLERPVAIRILSAEASADAKLRDRFTRDSMAISALRHPNIAQVYEWSRQDAIEFAVMETPEGESMYDFLDRERPQRRNLLRFASGIASALGAAHAAGFVHGPLNPSAIFITPRSEVKIFDFGFGVVAPPPESGPAAPYVSPEQAQGGAPDIRSDIFSYGALVYHLTTGQQPFRIGSAGEPWAAIIQNEAKPIAQLTSRAPRGMDKLIERCLRKNPQRRFQQIAEVEPLLEKMADSYRQNPEEQASFLSRNFGRMAKGAGIILAAAAATSVGVLWWQNRPKVEPVIGSHIRPLTKDNGLDTDPTISADGSWIAYASDRMGGGNLDIWVQSAEGGPAARVTDDFADDHEPSLSPDGATIAFRSERNGGGVYLVPSKGGDARLLAPEGRGPRFSPDGQWIAYWVGPPGLAPKADGAYKVFIVPPSGGQPRRIGPDFASAANPVWSPDSKRLLFLGRPDSTVRGPNSTDWWVASIEGKAIGNTGACRLFRRTGDLALSDSAIPGEWLGNHIFYSVPRTEGSRIWRTEIDSGTLSVTGKPAKVTNDQDLQVLPSAAMDGHLVFSKQTFNADIWSLPVLTNEGKVNGTLKRMTSDPAIDVSPSLSADGAKLLFQSHRSGHYNLMLTDVASGKTTLVAPSPDDQIWPVISPDGSKVAWTEMRVGRYEHLYKPAAGGPTGELCQNCGPAVSGWSRDGRLALVDAFDETRSRLGVGLVMPGGGKPVLILQDPASNLRHARFSPDDRWIAFVARFNGGSSRVYVAPFHDRAPVPPKEWTALTDGGAWESAPQWSPDGKLVYYISTRDGFHCVWAQRLDAPAQPSGPPFAVTHFHGSRLKPVLLPFNSTDLYVAHDRILLSLGELTGNIWSARVR